MKDRDFEKIPDFDLLPCPHCGKKLVKTSDHHGEYYEHPGDGCAHAFHQVLDEPDAKAWNKRAS